MNETDCPVKCFNMDCEGRDYKACHFFQTLLSEKKKKEIVYR